MFPQAGEIVIVLAQAHAEHDREFGTAAERNYDHPPEIRKALADSCKRSGASEADEAISALHQEMEPLANAINAAPVTSIEGLRAKALVAFWEVAPPGMGETQFSFATHATRTKGAGRSDRGCTGCRRPAIGARSWSRYFSPRFRLSS